MKSSAYSIFQLPSTTTWRVASLRGFWMSVRFRLCRYHAWSRRRTMLSIDSTAQLLETKRLLTNYYVDAHNGDDDNPGTEDAPFASYLPFAETYGDRPAHIGKIDLVAGDVVQFLPGVYSDTFAAPNDVSRAFYLRNVHGTESEPVVIRGIPGAILDAGQQDGKDPSTLVMKDVSHIRIEGFEFTGYGKGLILQSGTHVNITDNWFHDIDGDATKNIAAVEIKGSDQVNVANNLFQDNYDKTRNHQNSRHIVLFSNDGSIRVHHNYLENTLPAAGNLGGAGIDVKHGDDGDYEADHNIIVNASNSSLGTSNPNSHLHHNLIVNSAMISVRDFGGAAYFNNIDIEHNTQVSTNGEAGGGLSYFGKDSWYGGIRADYFEGDLDWSINEYNGRPQAGAVSVSGTYFEHRDYYNDPEEYQLGETNSGVIFPADRTGEGYVMFSEQDVFERFRDNPPQQGNANHLLAVRWVGPRADNDLNGTLWEYSTGSQWQRFQPDFHDILLATVDMPNLGFTTANTLEPMTGIQVARHGRPIESFQEIGSVNYSKNLIVDSNSHYSGDRATVRVNTYGTDRLYKEIVEDGNLTVAENVVYVPTGAAQYNLFNANGGTRGEKGAVYDLLEWQQAGFGAGSLEEDPLLDSVYHPENLSTRNSGWYAGEAARLTVLVTGASLVQEGDSTEVVVVRSGQHIDVSKALTVKLSATDESEVQVPASVIFQPGQFKASFSVSAIADSETDGTRAVRISAAADGFTQNVSGWLRVQDNGMMGGMTPAYSVRHAEGTTVVSEDGSLDSLSVVLLAPPMSDVILNATVGDSTEVSLPKTSLRFTPSNWNVPQAIVVAGVDDSLLDGPQTSRVTVSVDPLSDSTWRELPGQSLDVVTADNDQQDPGDHQGVLTLPGNADSRVHLNFEWSQRLGQYHNELGVLVADAPSGTVNGIAPDQDRYAEVALSDTSRRVVFESGSGAGARSSVSLHGGAHLVFYLVQNATTSTLLDSNPSNDYAASPIAFFSVVEANKDHFDHVKITDLESGGWRFAWEDLVDGGDESFTDAVIDLSVTMDSTGGRNDVYQQHLSSNTPEKTVVEGGILEVPVVYKTLDPNGQATALSSNLISVNLHFDENGLEFLGVTDVLQEGLLVDPTNVRPETHPVVISPDHDAATDSVLTAAFSDNDGATNPGWPNAPDADGVKLYLARFRAKTGLKQTAIHFTSNATGTVTGERAEYEFASESVTVSVVDTSGDVDGDSDFDANDSFLVHLVMLSGSNEHVRQNLGASPLSAAGIRSNIQTMAASADVDGDGDFDANDSFLIHLVKLSGSNDRIELNKGVSPLSAEQIRQNIQALSGTGRARIAREIRVDSESSVVSPVRKQSTTAPSIVPDTTNSLNDTAAEPGELFGDDSVTNHQVSAPAVVAEAPAAEVLDVFESFREWVDVL